MWRFAVRERDGKGECNENRSGWGSPRSIVLIGSNLRPLPVIPVRGHEITCHGKGSSLSLCHKGLGFRVQGLGFRVLVSGFRV